MDKTSKNNIEEYRRLKLLIHTAPILSEKSLLKEIEDFGKDEENRRYYKKLKKRFLVHRKIHKEHFPLGIAPAHWTESQTPLVSVIVPNYCHAPYLKERIECILNQTFQNFELILLDDCSTDNSPEILLSYKNHPKVSHVVINEKNSGNTFLQWEKGVALAKGRYIWIAESDDFADETFLEAMMAIYYMHPDCTLVRSGSYQINEKGRVLFRDWDYWTEDAEAHYFSGKRYIRKNMLRFNYIYNASMVVFRKDVFLSIDKSYQHLRYTGDWQCWIEFLERGPICEYRRKLNYFRQHDNKVSMRSNLPNKGLIDQFMVLAYVLEHIRISLLRKLMIRGEMYEVFLKSFRYVDNDPIKDNCFDVLKNKLGAKRCHMTFYKMLKLLGLRKYLLSERKIPKARTFD